ncbi:MAG: hypothetical protein LUI87_05355 [Lachnospiraceae bacterium]|nr:hypothetical protein [Lachnospiraceae bacterium]
MKTGKITWKLLFVALLWIALLSLTIDSGSSFAAETTSGSNSTDFSSGKTTDSATQLLNGFVTESDGFTYYYENSVKTGGWLTIGKNTYYFYKSAHGSIPAKAMVTDTVVRINGYSYYFDSEGIMQTGWVTWNKKTYYFYKSSHDPIPKGAAAAGLVRISGYRYYFSSTGQMKTGWQTINGSKYYFKKTASSAFPKGAAVTGLIKISGYRYYFSSSGKMQTGWKTINGNEYYFRKSNNTAPKGSAVTGLVKINGYQYYFNSSGIMQQNQIVGSSSEGYYYVDDSGKVVTTKAIQMAVDYVMAHSSAALSNSARLETCFKYMRSTYSYKRYYGTPGASDLSGYAVSYFTNHYGNCYRYAASVACIAKVLGYDSRVAVGKIASVYGGWSAHGWAEVNVNGTWYICDVNFNAYMKTTSTYPRSLQADNRYTLTLSEGIAVWK